jgi:hypothetical protein
MGCEWGVAEQVLGDRQLATARPAAQGGAASHPQAGALQAAVLRYTASPILSLGLPEVPLLQPFIHCCKILFRLSLGSWLQERGPWQATLRALCALEAVIEQGSSVPCGEVAVHFQVGFQVWGRASACLLSVQ